MKLDVNVYEDGRISDVDGRGGRFSRTAYVYHPLSMERITKAHKRLQFNELIVPTKH